LDSPLCWNGCTFITFLLHAIGPFSQKKIYLVRECITFCSIVWQLTIVYVNSCETYIHMSRVMRINLLHINLFIRTVFFIIHLCMKIPRIESYFNHRRKSLVIISPFLLGTLLCYKPCFCICQLDHWVCI